MPQHDARDAPRNRPSPATRPYRRAVPLLASYAALGGLVSLAGWAADLRRLTDWDNNGISIQPNAAVAAAASGTAVLLLHLGHRRAAMALGALVTFIGAATLFEYLSGIPLGIHGWLLFGHEWGRVGVIVPGRMGPPGAASWTILGASILMAARGPQAWFRKYVPALPMIPAAIASLSLIGYIFGASPLYTIPTLTIIALQTATFILATSLALILCIPDVGIVRLGREDSPAGLLTRRLVPVLILVPIVLGILQVAGERAGLYDAAFGSAIRTVFAIGLFVLLLWSTGTALNRQTEQRKRAEEERERLLVLEREARAEAERQAMLKDEFLATLSHELRTPLHAILGWSEILRKDLGNRERALEALSVIERNGRIQTQLIGDLLDMSRIVSGTLRLDVQRVELSNVIEAAFEAVRPAAEAKDLTIGRHVAVVSEPVYGDPRRLQQVVWNVLSNAVKFTPKGGRIDIALDRADAHAEIRVTDTGEGIAPEFLPHLFERFRQADGTVARAHGGLGLGLALVRQLVELHGGEAHATSDGRGRGATFVIRLPLARIPASDGARQSFRRVVDAPVTRRRSDSLEGLHILVVEDEPDALRMVRRTLEDGGATVSTAPGTDEALNLLVQDRFDLVLSDIGLPGRDGHEFIRECRARGVTTPAIALTAFARAEDRRRALEAGYQDHLTKPLELAELLSAIAAFTGSRAGADAPPTHA